MSDTHQCHVKKFKHSSVVFQELDTFQDSDWSTLTT